MMIVVYFLAFSLFLWLINRRDKGLKEEFAVDEPSREPDYFARIRKDKQESPREGFFTVLDNKQRIGNIPFVILSKGMNEPEKYNQFLQVNPYLVARGIDRNYRPACAYFVHYAPFQTDRLWVPLVTLSKRLQYKSDNYLGFIPDDAWQTSRYTYRHRKGDCEDHSILLADWFSSMGYDARVVIGNYHWSVHAWVILFIEGKEYLIEATKKNREKRFNTVFNKFAYQPLVMFNGDFFWVNQGSLVRTSYSGGGWKKIAKFEENE